MITVLVVDPQRLFREGIRTLIEKETDIEVVAAAENEEDALQQVEKLQPDVVLLHLPKLEAVQACTKIKDMFPNVRVVHLTNSREPDIIFRAIASGADGFLDKELYPDMLTQAIRDAYRGNYVLSGSMARILVNQVRRMTVDDTDLLGKRLENNGINLTKRELEIVSLMVKGYSNKLIAKKLHLSEGTVKNYISEIYMKLGIHQREKAIQYLEDLLDI